MDKETVKNIAVLARLEIDEASLIVYAKQLETIMNYVDTIRDLELSASDDSIGLSFVHSLDANLVRADKILQESEDNLEKFIEASTNRHENYFRSPKAL